ncbi:membrane hypothetical protein [Candidatus Sulfotelmatobacter sp. SbA7]|nr:membrane hypothetical protein [Candidatus Sulfotelmatobacter sp. SbA7]
MIDPTAPEDSFDIWLDRHVDLAALVFLLLGFVLRLGAACGTFLNPDEALHFFVANQSSWASAYRASLTMAHPPLLIFLLYAWRNIGTSELVLRLPFVLAGTGFCWVFFKWLRHLFGKSVALTGLTLVSLLPPLVRLSAEVRQYELLLLFAIGAAYFLEKALAANSVGFMLLSSAFTCLSMLSHYSAFLFAAVLGIYSLWRIVNRETTTKVVMAWVAGQTGALGLASFLYVTHISRVKGTSMAEQAFDSWLSRSYFHSGQGSPLVFMVARSFSVFQYLFGQFAVGDIAGLLFIAGIVFLLRNRVPLPRSGPTALQFAALLILPFASTCALALLDVYPYGGTRHAALLAIFAIAGISLGLAGIARKRMLPGVIAAAGIVLLCFAFPSRYPYISRDDQKQERMQQAVRFVREQMPPSAPLFVDYESGILLGHYLCEQKQVVDDGSIPGFLVFSCGGHRIVSTMQDLWGFTPQMFLQQWSDLVRNGNFQAGETVWVGQAGWIVNLDDSLRKEFPEFRSLQTHAFGRNIKFFTVTVGQAMPSLAARRSRGFSYPNPHT